MSRWTCDVFAASSVRPTRCGRRSGAGAPIPGKLARSWRQAMVDGIARQGPMPTQVVELAALAAERIQAMERRGAAEKTSKWRTVFRQWSKEALSLGAALLRDAPEPRTFNAQDMADDWSGYWAPSGERHVRPSPGAWRDRAVQAGLSQRVQADVVFPSRKEFSEALVKVARTAADDLPLAGGGYSEAWVV